MRGGRRFQRLDDAVHHRTDVPSDIVGPEAQHDEAVSFEYPVSHGIACLADLIAMLEAIDLDSQPTREADEVEEVAPERRLPSEVEAALAERLEARPEHDLWLAHVPAEGSGARDRGSHAGENVPNLFSMQQLSLP
jgi:hypothetical protein